MRTLNVKTIVLYLMQTDGKEYVATGRVQKLFVYIYHALAERDVLRDYDIAFDASYYTLTHAIMDNSRVFTLDEGNDRICLRTGVKLSALLRENKLDGSVQTLIKQFVQKEQEA